MELYYKEEITSTEGYKSKTWEGVATFYYKPEKIELFSREVNIEPSWYDMIRKKYIASNDKVYGYYSC